MTLIELMFIFLDVCGNQCPALAQMLLLTLPFCCFFLILFCHNYPAFLYPLYADLYTYFSRLHGRLRIMNGVT